MLHLFLAPGFEEIEALATLDILRRCGLSVTTISVTGRRMVIGVHDIAVMADDLFRVSSLENSEGLILPGGMPGAQNLMQHDGLIRILSAHYQKGTLIAAICAAPMILGQRGMLKGRVATCYPGFESYLEGAEITSELVAVSDNIITGKGPGAAIPFAFEIASRFVAPELVQRVRFDMKLDS